MTSSGGGGQSNRGDDIESSPKGKNAAAVSSTNVDQLNQGLGDMSLDSSVDSGWEVLSKNYKNGDGNRADWEAWGQADAQRTGGRGNDGSGWVLDNTKPTQMSVGSETGNENRSSNAIPPPLQTGWNWKSKAGSTMYSGDDAEKRENVSSSHPSTVGEVDEGNDIDDLDGSEDELLSDDYDSDESQKSHDSRKKNLWFAEFFGTLDALTAEQINEPARQWHCPACQNGPGSINWFRSMQSFVTHVKTKGPQRAKLHQDLAEILEEELCRRGATVVPAGETYGQWKGLNEDVHDREIVWPPMVIIMNTQLEQDENEKRLGMGTQELLDYFDSYEAVRARHSFGPEGHRGMSVLIFETSAVGYLEAERLSKHFEHQGTDRDAWDHHPNLFYPGGKRQLYGYMAKKGDLDIFNQHSPGKFKLKFELVSYQEKVVNQLKQMNKDSQQLHWYKNKIAKQERNSKALEEAFWLLSQKLLKLEETCNVRQRTQLYHEQNKEEMDFQEKFFKDQLKGIPDARDGGGANFEKLQQEECEKVEKSFAVEDTHQRKEKGENFIKLQTKEMKEFEEEREKLMKLHEEERAEMKHKHGKEEIEMEERFIAKLDQLMEKYTQLKAERAS